MFFCSVLSFVLSLLLHLGLCLVCCSLIYLFLLSCVVSLSDYHFRLLIEILAILHMANQKYCRAN